MIQINYSDSRPIYEKVKDSLQKLILSGALPEDSRLPSVRELAVSLTINPNTIQRAYRELEQEGYVCSNPGRGSFVLDQGGAVAARATSAWLLLEREGFRPCRASDLIGISDDTVVSKLPRHFPPPGKLRAPDDASPAARLESRVLPSEIDLNCHFNNAMYAARMSDVLGGASPRLFQLNFQRSVAAGETVEYLAWREGEGFTVSGRAGGEECFIASGVL